MNDPTPFDGGTATWRLTQLERAVEALESKVDRLIWALTLATLSFAGTCVLLVVLLVTGANGAAGA